MHNHIKGKGLKSSFLHMKYGQSINLENPIAIIYKIVNSNPITVVPGPILPHWQLPHTADQPIVGGRAVLLGESINIFKDHYLEEK